MWIYHVYGHDNKPISQFVRTIQETIPAVEPFTVEDNGLLIFRSNPDTRSQEPNECIVCVAPNVWKFVTVQWKEDKNVE